MRLPEYMTMRNCIDLLGMNNRYNTSARATNNICPCCGDSRKPQKKKLNINFAKNTFNCPKCGFKGGVLDFWAYHRDIPRSDAFKDFKKTYQEVYGGGGQRPKRTPPPKQDFIQQYEEKEIDFSKTDRVYSRLLSLLTLNEKHLENLQKRGLSEEGIAEGMYKSFPQAAAKAIPARLLQEGFELNDIPGFYEENGTWKFVRYGDGFLIPSKTVDGKIGALQVRMDNTKGGSRYLTLSSDGYPKGMKGCALPNFNPGRRGFKEVIITEGALKGNIISDITGYATLSVLGVNSTKMLPNMLRELREKGLKSVKIAFDMDYLENKNVQEACMKLEKMIFREGFRQTRLVWDPKYKGLDDFLAEN